MSLDSMPMLRDADPARDERVDPWEADALLRHVLAAPTTLPRRAHPRRRWALVTGGAACLLLAGALLVLLPRPGPAERAYAAVTPQEEILHIRSTLLVAPLVEKGLVPANRRLTWEAGDPYRVRILVTALRPDDHEVEMFETASSPEGTRSWSPSSDEIPGGSTADRPHRRAHGRRGLPPSLPRRRDHRARRGQRGRPESHPPEHDPGPAHRLARRPPSPTSPRSYAGTTGLAGSCRRSASPSSASASTTRRSDCSSCARTPMPRCACGMGHGQHPDRSHLVGSSSTLTQPGSRRRALGGRGRRRGVQPGSVGGRPSGRSSAQSGSGAPPPAGFAQTGTQGSL